MLSKYKHHLWLHLVILIFGFTGVFGKLIHADSYLLVWYRVGIALLTLTIFFAIIKHKINIKNKHTFRILLVGVIIAAHWITFFESIKQSNVSIALVYFSSSTLFTSLIEPFYFKRRIKPYELILGVIIIIGLSFIFSFEISHYIGMILSIISAALASWFTVLNGILIKENDAKTISYLELISAFVTVSAVLIFTKSPTFESFSIIKSDILWLLLLGTICTAFAFIVSIEVMKKISPYTVTMSVNLEPIYSIILALLIWPESETMSAGFYAGAGIVISTIILNAYLKGKELYR